MNYEVAAEIGLIAGVVFFFLAVLLFFALEIPALLREMRSRRRKNGRKLPAENIPDEKVSFSEAAETMLLGETIAASSEIDEKPADRDGWTSFRFFGWEIGVRSRRKK